MWKLSERSSVGVSDWLTGVVSAAPSIIQPPQKTSFLVQRMDTKAGLDHDVVAADLKSACMKLLTGHGDAPNKSALAESDGIMAVAVHRAFAGLTPREASDPDLWAWFSVFSVPGYVRWRWPTTSLPALAGRMAGSIRRNALARLWWWAEVTLDPSVDESNPKARYAVTLNVEDRQDLILWCGDCAFAGKREIVHSLDAIQRDHSLGSRSQQLLCRYVNRMLRTVCVDALPDKEAIRAACDRAYTIGKQQQAGH
jgi:hypothetical protein